MIGNRVNYSSHIVTRHCILNCSLTTISAGGTPQSKYSTNLASSRLNVAISNAAGSSINSAFESSYSDGGLFGFSVATSADSVGEALKAGAAEMARLAAGDFSDEDVERAKRQAKAEALMHAESIGEVGKALAVGLLKTQVRIIVVLACHLTVLII